MRRHVSAAFLLFAWLCANGALLNIVQVVAWAKMFHDYSQVMPVARALQVTFDGSKPCEICSVVQKAQDTARDQSPRSEALGASTEKILLVSESVPVLVLVAPDLTWPGAVGAAGLTRTEAVPVPPPRV